MIERLDQLTLADLIEVSCGNTDMLGYEDKVAGINAANRIIMEYMSIAQPQAAKMRLTEGEEIAKLRMREKCLKICQLLCDLGRPERVKDVLLELGVSEEFLKDGHAIEVRCQAMLDEVRYEIKRAEEGKEKEQKETSPEKTRKAWYSEIAFVMSMLKTSIDPATLNAAIYANLVHSASERSKTLAKMPPSMGMFL